MSHSHDRMKNPFFVMIIASGLLIAATLPGCTSTQKTTRTETTASGHADEAETPITQTTETETTRATARAESPGIIGTTFHVIGKILAFPFKVVAMAIEAVF